MNDRKVYAFANSAVQICRNMWRVSLYLQMAQLWSTHPDDDDDDDDDNYGAELFLRS